MSRILCNMIVTFLALGLAVHLSPAQAPSGADPSTMAFRVQVSGDPGQRINLSAIEIPAGYLASFCTARVCAPFRVSFRLPASGHDQIEMQLIKNQAAAPRPLRVGVTLNDSVHTRIAIAPPNRSARE